MKKLTAVVFAHKKSDDIRDHTPYMPIQLGKALHPDLDLGYTCDNTGNNISHKNATWNELTGIYWVWQNLKDTEYIATCHYRRYLDAKQIEKNIDRYFKDTDILVANTHFFRSRDGVMDGLCTAVSTEDAWILIDTLLMMHPEYAEGIKMYFFDNHIFFKFNMFVMPQKLLDEYCNFIFPVLETVEKRIKEHPYSRQKRAIGYMGEWMLGAFIICKQLKFKEVPWTCPTNIQMSHTMPDKDLGPIQKAKRKIRYWLEKHRKHKPLPINIPDDIACGLASDGIELKHIK